MKRKETEHRREDDGITKEGTEEYEDNQIEQAGKKEKKKNFHPATAEYNDQFLSL